MKPIISGASVIAEGLPDEQITKQIQYAIPKSRAISPEETPKIIRKIVEVIKWWSRWFK